MPRFFVTFDGKVYALNLETGKKIWHAKIQVESGITSSPIVDNNIIYLGSNSGTIHALNSDNGESLWTLKIEGAVETTLALRKDTLFFGTFDQYIYAVDAKQGKVKWKFETGKAVLAHPVVAD